MRDMKRSSFSGARACHAVIGVSMTPGASALTRTPSFASSCRQRLRVAS
jgi:hypothetical protein